MGRSIMLKSVIKTSMFIAFSFQIISFHCNADEAFVYCGKYDGSSWYPLSTEYSTALSPRPSIPAHRIIKGTWHKYAYNEAEVPVLLITENTYQYLKSLCRQDYNPHPAISFLDLSWYGFAINKNGVIQMMPGYISINLPPEFELAQRM